MIALPLSITDALKLTNLGIKREVENERRRLEREHEMYVLRLILSHLQHPQARPSQLVPEDDASCYGQFYPEISATSGYQNPIYQINPSVDDKLINSNAARLTTLC